MKPPLLFLGWGNPSRGDDAIGPLLCDRLAEALGDVSHCEVQQDFQLQIEDAMDIEGRALVIFIDASVSAPAPFDFRAAVPRADGSVTTHAMSPEAVLATTREILGDAPPAFVMAVRGEAFGLGEPMSSAARGNLEAAWQALVRIASADDAMATCQALAQR